MKFVFALAVELGIDDPLHWYNVVGDKIIDAWMGFKLAEIDFQNDQRNEALSASQALEKLNGDSINRRSAV